MIAIELTIPCKRKGPILVGFSGSNIHFNAIQFVIYPTTAPPFIIITMSVA